MGIIQPPWVSKKWFERTPFNYCDHFGDQEELALVCKVCKEDIEWKEKLIKEGRNPNDWGEVFKEVGRNLALAMAMIQKDVKRLKIDLDNLEDVPNPREIQPRRLRIYRIAEKYRVRIERVMKDLEYVTADVNIYLLKKAMDVFGHSRNYMVVKIHRALGSRKEEQVDKIMREVYDSKTSALLAYLAVDRNARALRRLSKHKPLIHLKKKFLKIARISEGFRDLIKEEFFPDDEIKDKEFGCESYNRLFP